MSENTESPAGTELAAQVAPGALALATGSKSWTIADLAAKLAGPAPVLPADSPAPAPAAKTALGTNLKRALALLPKVFGKVQPTESRKLEQAELAELTDEAIAIHQVTKPLGARLNVISEIVRHHMDHAAEADGLVNENTLRVAKGVAAGHYLIARPEDPFTVPVEGYEEAWQQRYVSGGVNVSAAPLPQLLESEKITREEFLAFTRSARVYDEANAAAFIRKFPQRGLEILALLTTRDAPGASLYPPKK